MYVDVSSVYRNGKTYTRYLLRESYREGGQVKHRTLANLSHCTPAEVEAIRLALQHKEALAELGTLESSMELHQGLAVGAIWAVYDLARQLGIEQALGRSREAQLALWQVIARVVAPGSRLSAVRLAGHHAACDMLGLEAFDEEDLYAHLDWLCTHQAAIEDRLFRQRTAQVPPDLFLYDVTSSYLEGTGNALAAFGYNRDGKRGKRQIVLGLLCDGRGRPLSIEVFAGNAQDPQTFASQVEKAAERFGAVEVTFVGDRGMIKSAQMEALGDEHFHYITAITKPQIEALLKAGLLQMGLFDEPLAEVNADDGVRYILRRNPQRAQEMAASREERYQRLGRAVEKYNGYLAEHPRARVEVALRTLGERSQALHIAEWVELSVQGREIALAKRLESLAETARLDGCYVLKTDLVAQAASKEVVHDRYRDLALVEWAFRQSKTVYLEMRPVFVRLESRTRGHALVVMLAYLIIQALAARWQGLDLTVQEGIEQLATLCLTEVRVKGQAPYHRIPLPRPDVQRLLDAAGVRLPKALPSSGVVVSTKKNLSERRKLK